MRIGTISFPAIDNYGAILQAQALVNVLERNGHEASVIDYQLRNLKFLNRLHSLHLSYLRHAPGPVLSTVPELLVRFSRIEQFRRQYLDRTRPVWRDDELQDVARHFDAVITGSDEVFRTDKKGDIFAPLFLDFADPGRQKLLAYAACAAGITDYGAKNAAVAKLLNRFHGISVRDETTRGLVKKLTGTDPKVVLDPTLLWPFDELSLPEPPAKDYLLVYGFFKSPQTDRMVRETADKLGIPMISVGWASKYAHRNIMAADTLQWLSCIKNARLMFTNCYHGLMFSTLYQRDFLIYESDQARDKLHDFINRFSLSSRLVPCGEAPSGKQLDGMDHAALQQRLKPYADDSLRFLRESVASTNARTGLGEVGHEVAGQTNPLDKQPLASLPAWRELTAKVAGADLETWRMLNAALAEKTVRNVPCHAEFAPWKNSDGDDAQNRPAFDWERGRFQGVPGWDWFHFVVQTSIHTDQLSVERIAAELKQMLNSDPFQKYADEAGISGFVRPLLLAYLLHQKWVVKPHAGGQTITELFELLSARWQMTSADPTAAPAKPPRAGWPADAVRQLKSAAAQMGNLFWEPRLTAQATPALGTLFKRDWPIFLQAALIFAIVGAVQYFWRSHLVYLPFYLVPCALLTWKVDRRWGALAAIIGALAGPLIASAKNPGVYKPDVMLWNMLMRFVILQVGVQFVEQIRRLKKLSRPRALPESQRSKFSENWAVVLACSLLFLAVVAVDFVSNPHMVFLPLYLLPCMVLTLVLNRRWGMVSALVAMMMASLSEYSDNPGYSLAEIFGWNFIMRLVVALTVVLLLDSIRRENILFLHRKTNGHSKGR